MDYLMTCPYILNCIFGVVNKNRFESGRDQVAIRKKTNLEIEESLELDRITSLNEINSSIIIETPYNNPLAHFSTYYPLISTPNRLMPLDQHWTFHIQGVQRNMAPVLEYFNIIHVARRYDSE